MNMETCEPLKSSDLAAYFLSASCGSKPQTIGIEFETLGLLRETGEALPLEGPVSVQRVFNTLVERYGWIPETTGGTTYLYRGDDGVISLEPGGQVELSTPHAESFTEICAKADEHQEELRAIGAELGVLWAGLGVQPVSALDAIAWVPKRRYSLMREFFRGKGRLAHAMMKQTASVQINLDYTCESDAAKKIGLLARVSPVLTAMFANSCVVEGRLTGFKSYRSYIWQNTDNDRCGLPECFFKPDFTFKDWAEYVLDVPMFFIAREGKLIGNVGKTFRQYMESGFEHYRATTADWELHLSCLFPEVRIKKWIELRSIDRQHGPMAYAAPLLVQTLLYNESVRTDASTLFASVGHEDCALALKEAARYGLQGEMGGFRISDLATELMSIVARAFRIPGAIGEEEKKSFETLMEFVEQKISPADQMIQEVESKTDILDIISTRQI